MRVKRFVRLLLVVLAVWPAAFFSSAAVADDELGSTPLEPCPVPDYAEQTVTDDYAYPEDWLERVESAGTIQLDDDLPCAGVKWTVWGNGASINNSGLLTLSATACGSYTAIARDSCGNTQHHTGQLGHWAIECEVPDHWWYGTCNGSTYQTEDYGWLVVERRKQCHGYPYEDLTPDCDGYPAVDFGQSCGGGCPYTNISTRVKHWVADCP